jgi:undecaprenyl-diphosphatase
MTYDLSLFFALNGFAGQSTLQDDVIVFVASYLPFIIIGIVGLYLLRNKSYSLTGKITALTVAVAAGFIARFGIGSPIRYFFPRPRPFLSHQVHQLIAEHAPSFPSGHALFFFAFSTVVFSYEKRLGMLCFILTILVCAARVMAGIHYPSDILAGAAIGQIFHVLHSMCSKKFVYIIYKY